MLRKVFVATLLLIALVGLPLTVYIFQKPQDTRSRASGGTTISLIPQPGPGSSIEKTVGQNIPVDLMVDPGTNTVTLLRIQVRYDPTKVQPVTGNIFTPTTNFPTFLQVPLVQNGTISFVISTGSDPTKAIRTVSKAGTFTFKALEPTDESPTSLAFTGLTQAFSSGPNDQAAENILTSANPAFIVINQVVNTPTPTLTPSPTDTPTPTETPVPQAVQFSATAFLHGIGNSGDSTNPNNHSLSNKNPNRPQRNVTVALYNANNQLVLTKNGILNYDTEDGNYKGTVSMGLTIPTGDYIVKLKTDSFLQKQVPGFIRITPSANITLTPITLIAGDTNSDNLLNILDYNMITGCYSDFLPPTFCDDTKEILTDLNDNGSVNQVDYNLFLREITAQSGN